ncbi:hypothetical protein Gogos_008964 [Gossypium gossypioides]|uniref:NB-ARC domain-containing protein n=1 Tax=Gossypium gossypioides TaxID=34282 RepID=A0A7J9CD37_GOSGO|nr:hypothetical protein [Gossypium gossypioides]
MVQLNVMDEDEAWNLFNMNENLDGAFSEIIEVAMEVAKEYGGLPLASVPLARALRGKIINGWKLACHKINSSRLMNIEDVPKQIEKSTYMSLEMSYNNLGSNYVSLHDVNLDVARWIASKEDNGLEILFLDNYESKTPIGINFKKSSIIELLAYKDRIPAKSSSATFNEIIEALKDYKVKKIEVWGMGGVGKTTLVKEVEHEVERFDQVIMVMVSRTPNSARILMKMAEDLTFNFLEYFQNKGKQ